MNEHFCYALVEDLAVRYVGYTARQLDRRRIEHRRKHPDWHFLLLGAYPSRAIGLEQENWWIKRLHNAGYTLTNIAEGGTGGITGLKTSYLTRAKLSKAALGNRHWLGRKHTLETRAKLSEARKGNKNALGCKRTPEVRMKISEAMRGKQNSLGRYVSPETRAKMSAAQKARWTRKRMAEDAKDDQG